MGVCVVHLLLPAALLSTCGLTRLCSGQQTHSTAAVSYLRYNLLPRSKSAFERSGQMTGCHPQPSLSPTVKCYVMYRKYSVPATLKKMTRDQKVWSAAQVKHLNPRIQFRVPWYVYRGTPTSLLTSQGRAERAADTRSLIVETGASEVSTQRKRCGGRNNTTTRGKELPGT